MPQRLGDLLAAQQLVSPRDIDEALKLQKIHGGRVGSILVELEKLDLRALAEVLRGQLGVPIATEDMISRVDSATAQRLTRDQVERFQALPLRVEGRRFHVAMIAPQNLKLTEELQFLVGLRLVTYVAPELQIAYWMKKRYGVDPSPRFIRLPTEDVISRSTGRRVAPSAPAPSSVVPTKPTSDDEVLRQRAALFGPSLDSSSEEQEVAPAHVAPGPVVASPPATSSPPPPNASAPATRSISLPPPTRLPNAGAPPVLLRPPNSMPMRPSGLAAASVAASASPSPVLPASPFVPASVAAAVAQGRGPEHDDFKQSPFYVPPLAAPSEEAEAIMEGEVLDGASEDGPAAPPSPQGPPSKPLSPPAVVSAPSAIAHAVPASVPVSPLPRPASVAPTPAFAPAPTVVPPAREALAPPMPAPLAPGEDWGSLLEGGSPAPGPAADTSIADLDMEIVEEPLAPPPAPAAPSADVDVIDVDLDVATEPTPSSAPPPPEAPSRVAVDSFSAEVDVDIAEPAEAESPTEPAANIEAALAQASSAPLAPVASADISSVVAGAPDVPRTETAVVQPASEALCVVENQAAASAPLATTDVPAAVAVPVVAPDVPAPEPVQSMVAPPPDHPEPALAIVSSPPLPPPPPQISAQSSSAMTEAAAPSGQATESVAPASPTSVVASESSGPESSSPPVETVAPLAASPAPPAEQLRTGAGTLESAESASPTSETPPVEAAPAPTPDVAPASPPEPVARDVSPQTSPAPVASPPEPEPRPTVATAEVIPTSTPAGISLEGAPPAPGDTTTALPPEIPPAPPLETAAAPSPDPTPTIPAAAPEPAAPRPPAAVAPPPEPEMPAATAPEPAPLPTEAAARPEMTAALPTPEALSPATPHLANPLPGVGATPTPESAPAPIDEAAPPPPAAASSPTLPPAAEGGWTTSDATFGGRAALDLPEVEGDFELELSERHRNTEVAVERVALQSAAASLLPPSAVPLELHDEEPSGLELDTTPAVAAAVAPAMSTEDSTLARVLDSHRQGLDGAQTRAAFDEWLATVLDAVSERGAVMEVRGDSLIPVRLIGTSADPSDPSLVLPRYGATSFSRCLAGGRLWRGELNEPDELNFALRLGPTTRSVLIPVGTAGGPQWVLWGVIPASLASRDSDFAHFESLASIASDAARRIGA